MGLRKINDETSFLDEKGELFDEIHNNVQIYLELHTFFCSH